MHEYHAVESLIRQLLEKAKESNTKSVSQVRLALGELSDFTENSIQLYFQEFSKGTVLQNANLLIVRMKAKLLCKECGAVFEKNKESFECPGCKSMNLLVESGREFYILDMELEV